MEWNGMGVNKYCVEVKGCRFMRTHTQGRETSYVGGQMTKEEEEERSDRQEEEEEEERSDRKEEED